MPAMRAVGDTTADLQEMLMSAFTEALCRRIQNLGGLGLKWKFC